MAKNKNCPNCGAPYDVTLNKCPYCSTSYFDMSAIDIDNQEPFYLKIRSGDYVFTQLVVPVKCDIEHNYDNVYCCDSRGRKLASFLTSNSICTDIKFEAIVDAQHNNLMTISPK